MKTQPRTIESALDGVEDALVELADAVTCLAARIDRKLMAR